MVECKTIILQPAAYMIIGVSGVNKLIQFYIQHRKIQGCILKILVTALLESIDLLIVVIDAHDK